jgi:hypothetical protein
MAVWSQWLGLATIEQAQGGGMVYVRGHCTEQERDAAQYWRGVFFEQRPLFQLTGKTGLPCDRDSSITYHTISHDDIARCLISTLYHNYMQTDSSSVLYFDKRVYLMQSPRPYSTPHLGCHAVAQTLSS